MRVLKKGLRRRERGAGMATRLCSYTFYGRHLTKPDSKL